MLDIQESLVNELKRFTKTIFDLDAALTAASDLKYTKEIKQTMLKQLETPPKILLSFSCLMFIADCTAIGNLDHSLNQDCATITI